MKKRTKEENAAYTRDLRARKKAQKDVAPAVPAHVAPVAPAKSSTQVVAPCAECLRLREELTQVRAEVSRFRDRVRDLEAQPAAVKVDRPPLPPVACPLAPAAGKALDRDEAEALRLRVVADKVNRIRGYSSGHSIGSVRA